MDTDFTDANALKALRKLAQGWLVAPKSDEGRSEAALGKRPQIILPLLAQRGEGRGEESKTKTQIVPNRTDAK
jgi:hypothetical protein